MQRSCPIGMMTSTKLPASGCSRSAACSLQIGLSVLFCSNVHVYCSILSSLPHPILSCQVKYDMYIFTPCNAAATAHRQGRVSRHVLRSGLELQLLQQQASRLKSKAQLCLPAVRMLLLLLLLLLLRVTHLAAVCLLLLLRAISCVLGAAAAALLCWILGCKRTRGGYSVSRGWHAWYNLVGSQALRAADNCAPLPWSQLRLPAFLRSLACAAAARSMPQASERRTR